ncbi:DUF6291 domain-containing protein [Bizionia sp.]|uniref:DUF6291 domain-containing protein n=1 Tax=Bizionia sp. TaxID=1954480 RepID=UPI003A942FD8
MKKTDKNSFIAYNSWHEIFEELNDEEAGKLIKIIFRFANGLDAETTDKVVKMSFIPIKQSLVRDVVKWDKYIEKQSLNGKKGGRPQKPKKPTGFSENPTEPKKADSVSVSESAINNIYNSFVDAVKKGIFKTRIDSTYKRLNIKSGSLTPLLENFKGNLIENNTLHNSIEDFYKHFVNWLNKQDELGKLRQYSNSKQGGI